MKYHLKKIYIYFFKFFAVLLAIGLVSVRAPICLLPAAEQSADSDYDLVIKGGTIVNPSTEHVLADYNLAVKDGSVVRITQEDIYAPEVIDARGLVVSPGFIDLISYEPNYVGIPLKIHDGVTSNLLMHGGTVDAKSWYGKWMDAGLAVNFGASSFVTQLRWPIIGHNIDRSITTEEDINRLVDAVRRNIEEGAVGISFSLEYIPGIKSNEIIPLLRVANEYDAPTFYHTRYSSINPPDIGPDGVVEVIEYARGTGAAVHIMHINSTGGTCYMDEALTMIQDAIDEGLDVSACIYPYDAWATFLASARFRPGWKERFNLTYSDLQITGTAERLTKETFAEYRKQPGKLAYAHNSMPEEEIILALQDPNIMIGSDTIITPSKNNHPRGAGAFSRLFGKYVREEKVISLVDAIKKVSLQPARRMESIAPSMRRKGRIEIGSDADITIFNPETIIDKSTPENTAAASEGVEYVVVNGVVVKDLQGIVPGVAPGQPVLSYFVDAGKENIPVNYTVTRNNNYLGIVENAYVLERGIYLPVDVFDIIGMPVADPGNGKIIIDDKIEIEIGASVGYTDGDSFKLPHEPVIYKSNVYVHYDSFKEIIKEQYTSSLFVLTIELENK